MPCIYNISMGSLARFSGYERGVYIYIYNYNTMPGKIALFVLMFKPPPLPRACIITVVITHRKETLSLSFFPPFMSLDQSQWP